MENSVYFKNILLEWLSRNDLPTSLLEELHAFGAFKVKHLGDLNPDDIDSFNLKPLEKRRLERAKSFVSVSSLPTTVSVKTHTRKK